MEPQLLIAQYDFVFAARGRLIIPALADGFWHGVFGRALRELACVAPAMSRCDECLLRQRCDYPFLFQGVRPAWAEMMRKYDTIPVPHIFHFSQPLPPVIDPGKRFTQGLVLLGSANDRLPLIIRAMAMAGLAGFGKKRTRAELLAVVQASPFTDDMVIMEEGLLLNEGIAEAFPIPPLPELLRLQFLTPYLPSDNSAPLPELDISRFLMTIVRRISMLQYFYSGVKLEADFKKLKEQAGQTEIIDNQLTPYIDSGYSARQQRTIPVRGISGFVDIATHNLAELWSYLYLGQWLHLGKKASMGFGQYQLLVPVEHSPDSFDLE